MHAYTHKYTHTHILVCWVCENVSSGTGTVCDGSRQIGLLLVCVCVHGSCLCVGMCFLIVISNSFSLSVSLPATSFVLSSSLFLHFSMYYTHTRTVQGKKKKDQSVTWRDSFVTSVYVCIIFMFPHIYSSGINLSVCVLVCQESVFVLMCCLSWIFLLTWLTSGVWRV